MGEVDYQLALLLQHQFEQEYKKPKEYKSDLELARTLQEQFEKEYRIEKPGQELVYDNKKNNKVAKDSSKCLTDPSWEIIDPTPDIHMLFMAFNERFFWKKLLAVCVSWSKRMTTCAGICSYQGRGGMCSITLSEPLLKLRPRKDLVETLLHEMIHAYLFVTHNNKDRDGHGPEFHKHMYRINGEAGTNITVYHDFHDEVRLYQQHWWRCDGPCQKWKPYFGMVRRAMNRAPGPHDRWWGEHSRSCGGNFIKVKEPEKLQKKSTTKENKKPIEDIRNFIPSLNAATKTKQIPTTSNKPVSSGIIKDDIIPGNNKSFGNVHTISNKDRNNFSRTDSPKENNIFGFTDLNGSSSASSSKGNNNKSNIRGAVRNNSNTIVINKKPSVSTQADSEGMIRPIVPISTGSGRILSESAVNNNNLDYSIVRNHWVNKFSNGNSDTSLKRNISEASSSNRSKIPKLSPNGANSINLIQNHKNTAECPVCMMQVALIELNSHLDTCLETPKDNNKECMICGKKIALTEYDLHISKCSEVIFSDVFEIDHESDIIKCSFCGRNIFSKNYNDHIVRCSKDFVEGIDIDNSKNNIVDSTYNNLGKKQCAICQEIVPCTVYDSHMEKCLLKMYDDMEAGYSNNEQKVDCLACGKNIFKSELSSHLDDCMSLSRVFEDDNEPKEGETSKSCNNDDGNKYNCPFCMKLITASEMNSHIDICLSTVDGTSQTERDKSILVESLDSSFSDVDI